MQNCQYCRDWQCPPRRLDRGQDLRLGGPIGQAPPIKVAPVHSDKSQQEAKQGQEDGVALLGLVECAKYGGLAVTQPVDGHYVWRWLSEPTGEGRTRNG